MAEEDLQRFLEKVRQLNAFVALSEQDPSVREALRTCGSHHAVVALARSCGFEIGRRWGEPNPGESSGHPNLLESTCPGPRLERCDLLLETPQWRLERIHSCAYTDPAEHWSDQEQEEWVLLLRGSARLQFEDEPAPRELAMGDSLRIAAHRRHRVVATDPDPGTLWLALFWDPAT